MCILGSLYIFARAMRAYALGYDLNWTDAWCCDLDMTWIRVHKLAAGTAKRTPPAQVNHAETTWGCLSWRGVQLKRHKRYTVH